jgi:hypothetical protein
LDGVTDELVVWIYRMAKQAYRCELDIENRLVLNDLIVRIGRDKPTFNRLCTNRELVAKWYYILVEQHPDWLSPLHAIIDDEFQGVLAKKY